MITRRHLLGATGAASLAATLGTLSGSGRAADGDYRALVVRQSQRRQRRPQHARADRRMHNDYQTARTNLALPKASLLPMPGSAAGHTFGLHPALAPILSLCTPGAAGLHQPMSVRWSSLPRRRRCWPARWTCRPS